MPPAAYLAMAIVSEICATVALRQTHGFTRPLPSALVVAGYGLAFLLLSRALRGIALGTAYAVWSGVGTAVIAVIGVLAFGEQVTTLRVVSLVLVVGGVVGLNLSGAG